ncbi:Tetratricopeptide repeat protein 27like, partial [Caligus rogercresseyi]
LPVDMKLDDEVRLDKIAFKEERSEEPLNQIERATITAAFEVIRMSQPKDALTLEEVTPYLNSILAHNDTWSFQMSALYHRSMLESNESRTVERSMMQLSTLSEGLPTADENVARSRLKMIFVSQCLPFWKLEASLVKLFLALATRLELWEDVINCYHLLQLRHKAAEVIREQLSVKETPLLWCMLGDATDDISFYEKALDMSNGKFSRAHRSIGYHHYFKKDYKRSIESLKKSLELNGYQQHLRLRLGFAATECEEWELAASVYRSYCTFETDNFEAWNNLANAYIKLGQKSRAWKVLQEAAKCDYENWK